jgi:hypothetical protein
VAVGKQRNTAKQSVEVVGNKSTMVSEPCGRLSNLEASERTRWALHIQIFTSAVGKASVIFILSFLFSFFFLSQSTVHQQRGNREVWNFWFFVVNKVRYSM